MTNQLTVRLPQPMRREIERLAERQFTSEGAVVRQLISRALRLEPKQALLQPNMHESRHLDISAG